jgi:DNA-binding NarL/FixJ family response regulator
MSSVGSKRSARFVQHHVAVQQVQSSKEASSDNKESPQRTGTKPTDPIIVIDIHLLSRDCLSRVLSAEFKVPVLCYSTIEEWVKSGPTEPVSLVVYCQNRQSRADAIEAVERLGELSDRTGGWPAVILSDDEDPDLIVEMLSKNVRCYVPTSLPIHVAVQAMELARAGGVFVPASSFLTHRQVERAPAPPLSPRVHGLFTARQAAVVEALRRGKANKIIAHELKMRESTVKVHVRNIMKKLHATNRTQVAYLANRMLSGEEPVA